MCDTCWPVLGRFCRPHPKTPCPVAKALYCGLCGVYGHSPRRCGRRALRRAEPAGTEDTLYPSDTVPEEHYEIENDEASIKAALMVNDGVPMICQEKGKRELKEYGENKKRLVALVKERGAVLVLRGEGPKKTETLKR
jgi:hypothetical protein